MVIAAACLTLEMAVQFTEKTLELLLVKIPDPSRNVIFVPTTLEGHQNRDITISIRRKPFIEILREEPTHDKIIKAILMICIRVCQRCPKGDMIRD